MMMLSAIVSRFPVEAVVSASVLKPVVKKQHFAEVKTATPETVAISAQQAQATFMPLAPKVLNRSGNIPVESAVAKGLNLLAESCLWSVKPAEKEPFLSLTPVQTISKNTPLTGSDAYDLAFLYAEILPGLVPPEFKQGFATFSAPIVHKLRQLKGDVKASVAEQQLFLPANSQEVVLPHDITETFEGNKVSEKLASALNVPVEEARNRYAVMATTLNTFFTRHLLKNILPEEQLGVVKEALVGLPPWLEEKKTNKQGKGARNITIAQLQNNIQDFLAS